VLVGKKEKKKKKKNQTQNKEPDKMRRSQKSAFKIQQRPDKAPTMSTLDRDEQPAR
jgi:hypothetical protein